MIATYLDVKQRIKQMNQNLSEDRGAKRKKPSQRRGRPTCQHIHIFQQLRK